MSTNEQTPDPFSAILTAEELAAVEAKELETARGPLADAEALRGACRQVVYTKRLIAEVAEKERRIDDLTSELGDALTKGNALAERLQEGMTIVGGLVDEIDAIRAIVAPRPDESTEDAVRRALEEERARADGAEAQLNAIDALPEDVWENGEAAAWVCEIRNGNLDGLPTQASYEEDFIVELD
jgi:hypothetical protein